MRGLQYLLREARTIYALYSWDCLMTSDQRVYKGLIPHIGLGLGRRDSS